MLFIIWTVFISISVCAQKGQKKPNVIPDISDKTSEKSGFAQKEMTIKYTEQKDTTKVILVCYGENYNMIWLKGYVITLSRVYANGQKEPYVQIALDDKFMQVDIQNIYDIKQNKW